jgi:Ca2+-dependent lipid-binding protein
MEHRELQLLWTFGKILSLTFIYLLGRFQFSFTWLLPIFYKSIRDFLYKKDEKNDTQVALWLDEKKVLLNKLEDIPSWVLFPDFERAEWLNEILKQFWPKINHVVLQIVKELEPKLQRIELMKNFKFDKIHFGKIVR